MTTDNQVLEAMRAELEQLKAENNKLKNKAVGGIKIGPKGTVNLYGLGRFPISLYAQQWESLFERIDDVKAFIVAHPDLSRKPRAADKAKTEVATDQSAKADMVDEIADTVEVA